jgi:TRAP-type C4-dicarboxylate transport system substrate-binding protein
MPITTGLRRAVRRYSKYSSMTMPCPAVEYVKLDAATFDSLCDAIDAIHEALEGENEMLREWRKLDNAYENMQAAGGGR